MYKDIKTKIIRRYEELFPLVEDLGLLPLFTDMAPFSLWNMTVHKNWFTGDEETDPWCWRERAAREGRIAYGKFFGGKAGFVSLKLFPDLVNVRREGKTFVDYFNSHKISFDAALIMEQFRYRDEYTSTDLKKITGIKKYFESRIAILQHRTFLSTCDFIQKRTKTGSPYGWAGTVLCKPESVFGQSLVLSRFSVSPEESYEILFRHCVKRFPNVNEIVWQSFLS